MKKPHEEWPESRSQNHWALALAICKECGYAKRDLECQRLSTVFWALMLTISDKPRTTALCRS